MQKYCLGFYIKEVPKVSAQKYSDSRYFEKINQDIIDDIYDILEAFDTVCEQEKLPYMIACGTQLGASRHGGFIPWDIDGDVIILQDDEANY